MYNETVIKDFYGRRIGTIETDPKTGYKQVKDFYGKLLGTYDPKWDVTKDFYGRVVARGDATSMLLNQGGH